MLRSLLSLHGLCALSMVVHAQEIPNAGFEEWSGGNPVGWTTNNGGPPGTVVLPESPGHVSTTAMRGQVVEYAGSGYGPLVESLDANGQPFPVEFAYERFRFYYKLQLISDAGVESFNANVLFTDANGISTAVGNFNLFQAANTDVWTLADVPIVVIGPGSAHARITFMLGGSGAAPGSNFLVDNVDLGFMAGIDEGSIASMWGAAFPQPAAQEVNLPFQLDRASQVSIEVFDAMGRAVGVRDLGSLPAGGYKEVWPVSGLATGTHVAVLRTEQGAAALRFMVAR